MGVPVVHDVEEPLRTHRVADNRRQLRTSLWGAGFGYIDEGEVCPFHCCLEDELMWIVLNVLS